MLVPPGILLWELCPPSKKLNYFEVAMIERPTREMVMSGEKAMPEEPPPRHHPHSSFQIFESSQLKQIKSKKSKLPGDLSSSHHFCATV